MRRANIVALRMPLAMLAATVIVCVCALLYSGAMLGDARQLLTRAEMQLRSERVRVENAGEEKATRARYLGGYQQLAREGLTGEEQRMNWLDGLRAAAREANLSGIEYEIGAQRPYAHASEVDASPLRISESVMQIRLRLLHEGELERFLDALTRSGSGFFTVDRCILRRLPPSGSDAGPQARENLTAECELRWLTLRAPNKTDNRQ